MVVSARNGIIIISSIIITHGVMKEE